METGTPKANEPLPKMKCTTTNCEEGLHCFRPKHAPKLEGLTGGNCHACNVDQVDWKIVYKRDIDNAETTFSFLKLELIRNAFWTEPIEADLKEKILKRGLQKLTTSIGLTLKRSVFKSGRSLFRDGTQTPIDTGNLIYWAQHATATCCRKCIKYWHDIPYDRDLNENEFQYLQALIIKFFEDRIPEIKDVP